MKRKNGIEREYREMMTQAAPDLWKRIEDGLEDQTAADEVRLDGGWEAELAEAGANGPAGVNGPVGANEPAGVNGSVGANEPAGRNRPVGTNEPAGGNRPAGANGPAGGNGTVGANGPACGNGPAGVMDDGIGTGGKQPGEAKDGGILRLPRRRLYGAATAAAAALVILVMLPRFWDMNRMSGSTGQTTSGAAAYDAGATWAETMAGAMAQGAEGGAEADMVGMPETAVVTMDGDGAAPAGGTEEFLIAENEEEMPEMTEDAPEAGAGAADSASPEEENGSMETASPEHSLGDTQILCLATVRQSSHEAAGDGLPARMVYEIVVEDVYYRKDAPENEAGSGDGNRSGEQALPAEITTGSRITVEMPDVTGAAREDCEMILEERYLLPLTIRDGVWEPVIPDAPQIRRMENGGYLFPDIYRSLTETGESWNAQTPAGGEEGSGQIVIPEEEAVSMLTELIEGK